MTERLQSDDDRREIMRAQFLAEAALWGIESELTPERIEIAVEIELSHEAPDPRHIHRHALEQRRYVARKRQEQEGQEGAA